MDNNLKLNVQDVLDKQFNVDLKGYSSREVDEFLDLVIMDYQEYDRIIAELSNHLREYESMISSLKNKVIELEGERAVEAEKAEFTLDNVDILKRLTRLENEVFKKKHEETSDEETLVEEENK